MMDGGDDLYAKLVKSIDTGRASNRNDGLKDSINDDDSLFGKLTT